MLSTAAANALLKTLEEPPSHVVFVLATTDPQKVPPTIRSRTQHLEFRLLGAETLHGLLESVNAEAGLDLDEAALEAAVRRGRGSARDALSALDQVVASGSADAARPELATVLDALAEGDVGPVLVALERAAGGRLGTPAAGHRAHRRPAPDLPRRAGPRAVRGVGPIAPALHVAGRDDGPGAGGAQHGDPRPRAGRHARGPRRAGGARDRDRARRATRPRLGHGGALRAGERAGALALRRPRLPSSRCRAPAALAAPSPPAETRRSPPRRQPPAEAGSGVPRSVRCAAASRPRPSRPRRCRRESDAAEPDAPVADRRPSRPARPPTVPTGADRTCLARPDGVARPGRRPRQPDRGVGRRHPPGAAGAGEGALQRRPLRRGGRAGRALRAAQRGPPRPLCRAHPDSRGGARRALRHAGDARARHRREHRRRRPARTRHGRGRVAGGRWLPPPPGPRTRSSIPPSSPTDDAGGAAEGETSAAEARLLEAFPGASEVLG